MMTTKKACRPASSPPSTGSIRWRYGSTPKGGCGSTATGSQLRAAPRRTSPRLTRWRRLPRVVVRLYLARQFSKERGGDDGGRSRTRTAPPDLDRVYLVHQDL